MRDAGGGYLMGQLPHMVLHLILYLAVGVVACFYLGRARGAAILTLLAALVLGTVSLVVPLMQSQFVARLNDGGSDHETVRQAMSAIGIAGSVGHALGLLLLASAVFVGRRPSAPAAPPGAGTA